MSRSSLFLFAALMFAGYFAWEHYQALVLVIGVCAVAGVVLGRALHIHATAGAMTGVVVALVGLVYISHHYQLVTHRHDSVTAKTFIKAVHQTASIERRLSVTAFAHDAIDQVRQQKAQLQRKERHH